MAGRPSPHHVIRAEERVRDVRIERLSKASLRRVIEPDTEFTGALGRGQVVPDELLTVAGLGLGLTAEQRAALAREELVSVLRFGIIFECVLMSGFAFQMSLASDVTDPRFVYALHEIGEETRHSRMFIRLVEQLAPTQHNPFTSRRAARAQPTWTDRVGVRRVAPLIIAGMFDVMVQPYAYAYAYAYAVVGLPAWRTWLRVRREPGPIALRRQSARAVLRALLDAQVLRSGRIPRGWRRLAGVDRRGTPLPAT